MRSFYLFCSLLLVWGLTACGSEEVLTPPLFSNVTVRDSVDPTQVLTSPFQNSQVTISGTIDDPTTTIVANSTANVDLPVSVNSSDGSWSFPFSPVEGANIVTLTASDQRGNINQLYLTLTLDTTAPAVTAVVQNLEDLAAPKILVTLSETLNALQPTALFAVDGTAIVGATFDSVLTFTLPLSESLASGLHHLTCSGMVDLAGNRVVDGYSFDFTIE